MINKARRTALLRVSALSVAAAALATACSSSSSSNGTAGGGISPSSASSGSAVAASGSDLVIGTIGNFSGPSAEPSHLAGLQAWVDSVNASGGVKGRQIKLIVEDDQGDATKSQAEIRQLVQVDHVLAVVSPEASATESGWASYVEQQHVAVVGGEADTPEWFTNPAFFPSGATVLTSIEMQAYAVKAAGKQSFGAVYCAEIAACKQSVPALAGYAKAFHLDMSTSAAIAVAAPSYTAQCLAAKQANAQAVVIDASFAAGSRFAPACAQQGYTPVYVIPSGSFDGRYLQVAQVTGAYVPTTNALWFASTPAVNQFKKAMARYEPSTALGPNPMSGWAGGALFGAAAASLPAKATAADVFTALYSLPKNDTLDGLTPPLNFHSGAPASQVTCFFIGQIKGGSLTDPVGTAPVCP
ncbi:MAG: ABC transporter substrate-binding protein [Streptosporangiaceae bacterium]|nr:ABC transporter substrate-binding protein [Streptosporangiaceae bacterium]